MFRFPQRAVIMQPNGIALYYCHGASIPTYICPTKKYP
jgi:hypothetical protein